MVLCMVVISVSKAKKARGGGRGEQLRRGIEQEKFKPGVEVMASGGLIQSNG